MARIHDNMQELGQTIEGLDVSMLQQLVAKAAMRHGLELVNKNERLHCHDQKEIEPGTSYLNQDGALQESQVMVQQLAEKGIPKGNIPMLDNFNGDPKTTKIFFMFGRNR